MKLYSTRLLSIVFIVLFGSACVQEPVNQIQDATRVDIFNDLLDVKGIPQNKKDFAQYCFTDLGAWHGYALPETKQQAGGFNGPFLMSEEWGVWMGSYFAKMQLFPKEENKTIEKFTSRMEPGKLVQEYAQAEMEVKMVLIFIDNRTALQKITIQNGSKKTKELHLSWQGHTYHPTWKKEKLEQGVVLKNPVNGHQFKLALEGVEILPILSENGYTLQAEALEMKAGETRTFYLLNAVYFNENEKTPSFAQLLSELNTAEVFEKNRQRWSLYFQKTKDMKEADSINKIVYAKSVTTLIQNWRSSAGALQYDGLFPSFAYRGFYGFWSWDSWKHAVALAPIAPALAKDQIRTMYAYQNQSGMIADCIYRDTIQEPNNWRNTKPPLSGWAIHEVYKATLDSAFVSEMLPKLIQYHQWWYKERDHDGNGLCEYGSTDGTRIAAAWESGMDNAVRFDTPELLKNKTGAWSFSQESVDLNAYLFVEKKAIANLFKVVGDPEMALQFESEALALKNTINTVFYNSETGFYHDVRLGSQEHIAVYGPEGWIPLWAEIAAPEQAKAVVAVMMDTTKFNTTVPLPTFDASHPDFDPYKGYWRGPVWLDQVYFGLEGMRNYQYTTEAETLREKVWKNAEGVSVKGVPIRENYHPLTGKGLNAKHFSWSAAHLLLMKNENETK